MKTSISIISLMILLNSFTLTNAQGEAALPFLHLTPSPLQNGLGWTGASHPTDDPFGFYYNPAMLGYSSQTNNISLQSYPGSADWLNLGIFEFNSQAINLGYNFKKELNGLSLSAGAGFIHSRIGFGEFRTPTGSYDSYDSYNAYGLGASVDYYVLLSLGITFKSVHSELGYIGETSQVAKVDVNAIDYGILLSIPLIKLIDDNYSFQLSQNSKLIPVFNYNLGYSRLNIGDEVYYIDPAQSDPIPLTARLGHTFSFGFDYESDNISINLINYDLILEADDILIDRKIDTTTFSSEISYQSLLGDIDFGKHLIQLKGDNKVVVHKAHAINLVETVTILIGSFEGRGFNENRKTNGLVFSTRGLFKWFYSQLETDLLKFLAEHIDLKYISSSIFDKTNISIDGRNIETDLSGISLSLLNYSFN
ncbi:MAG: hypothetical protein A2V93_06475 [Ignavibacteria bacterium RBG_16_34_14]|nr:MAG: hypothetical protein A2V93_06475 [Ignavibacteria bacterium RBG_16_34_14]